MLPEQRVIFVDALLPELRAEGAPLFDRIRERWEDVQRAIAVQMWPKARDGSLKAPERLSPEEVKRRLREWLKSENDK